MVWGHQSLVSPSAARPLPRQGEESGFPRWWQRQERKDEEAPTRGGGHCNEERGLPAWSGLGWGTGGP